MKYYSVLGAGFVFFALSASMALAQTPAQPAPGVVSAPKQIQMPVYNIADARKKAMEWYAALTPEDQARIAARYRDNYAVFMAKTTTDMNNIFKGLDPNEPTLYSMWWSEEIKKRTPPPVVRTPNTAKPAEASASPAPVPLKNP